MLGIPRPELPDPKGVESGRAPATRSPAAPGPPPIPEQERPSHRSRAQVRYDSSFEPLPVTMRRRRAFGGAAVLVALATVWLIYRFLNA